MTMSGKGLSLLCHVILGVSAVTSQIFFPMVQPQTQPPPVVSFPLRQNKTLPFRVLPGMHQFPAREEFSRLSFSLDGQLITPMDDVYNNVTVMRNIRVTEFPFAHVMAASVEDVQRAVRFARKHNLMAVIRSSGHSYIGRSTHDGSIVINLANMKGKKFNLNSIRNQAGEVTLESGNTWIDVYEEVAKQVTYDDVGNPQRRVIVGGNAHTVAMGGYTQGGGHSPICRQLGLAVDSLLEATIVLADGRKAVVNEQGTSLTELDGATSHSNDTSLFWAIRGGGGGTWGVVTDFTFRLHYAPARFRNVGLAWALTYKGQDIGSDTLRFVVQQLSQLSQQWGGYLIVSGAPLSAEAKGSVNLFLNHFGSDDDASNHDVDALLAHNPYQNQYLKNDLSYPTFIGYEETARDAPYANVYVFDNFVQQNIALNDTKLGKLVGFFMSLLNSTSSDSGTGCTGTMIGGKMTEVPDGLTPVNPKFRSGLLALTCYMAWPAYSDKENVYIGHSMLLRDALAKAGEGSYFNEPAEDMEDWKVQFWGDASNYNRLLDAKRKWDPDNFFWCHNCVGSDDVTSDQGQSSP